MKVKKKATEKLRAQVRARGENTVRPTGKFRIVEVTPGKTEKMEYATQSQLLKTIGIDT